MKTNTYEKITNAIIAKIESSGDLPWRKPWAAGANAPRNLVSKKTYRGINIVVLGMQGYSSPYWVTFKQCKDKGGRVKRGEKGTQVVFWKFGEKLTGELDENGDEKKYTYAMLREYTVFNTDQCEGLKVPVEEKPANKIKPITKCANIVRSFVHCPEIRHGRQEAFYSSHQDYVNMPKFDTFDSAELYYSVLFHEVTHSTGHHRRLNRFAEEHSDHIFGSQSYSKEELVAEMGAAYLCGVTGIENKIINNSSAYIKSWLRALKNDKKMLIYAAAKAQRAADYIQNITHEVKDKEGSEKKLQVA